jgi:gliding motility-associated lipoprotein GldD
MKSKILFPLVSIAFIFLLACGNNYTPRPRGYFRIDLPSKNYEAYNSGCPYTFEYPSYSVTDTTNQKEPCWLNIHYPSLGATIHLSYKEVNGNLQQLLEDTRTFVYKHTIKADAIKENLYSNSEKDVHGILYEIKGNAASAIQFYLTDSTEHFIRGALYFDARPNKDSLAPVIDFVHQDILHLIETTEWK